MNSIFYNPVIQFLSFPLNTSSCVIRGLYTAEGATVSKQLEMICHQRGEMKLITGYYGLYLKA